MWFPLNHLVVQGLRRFHSYVGDEFQVEFPTGSGRQMTLGAVADEICSRLVSIFREADGRRPVFGDDGLSSRAIRMARSAALP